MALRSLFRRRPEPRALDFYRQFVRRGGLCFDVGANMGDRTDLFLRLGAQVVAVEPQRACQDALRERFGERIRIVPAALGPQAGEAELLIASYHTLSSLSREWTDAVRDSGRFSEFTWDTTERVPVATLDELIASCGTPDFCKIDVEGYEREVVEGLTQPVGAISFEFTVERLESRLAAVQKLDSLGMRQFNYSSGESMRLEWQRWVDAEELTTFLRRPVHSAESFGDVYARV
jgi:FkbM family methyltransferase